MPPLAIAAGIAAVGTIGGALIGSHAQSQANSQAAATQNAATQAQLQLGQQSLALNQGIYNSNYDLLSPFVSRGNVAGNQINALLGLGAAPALHSPLAGTGTTPTTGGGTTGSAAPAPAAGGYTGPGLGAIGSQSQMDNYLGYYQQHPEQNPGFTSISPFQGDPYRDEAAASSVLAAHNAYMASHPATPAVTTPNTQHPTNPATTPHAATPAASASSALNNFANSAGMQFQMQQGTNALNNLYAGRGTLQSGDAMKGIQNYGQQTALNNYFMPYMGLLGGQQAVGAQAGGAVAGVGSSFGNTAAGINGQMGQAINNGAQNIGNLQLANGQNKANMWGSIGGALGGLASSFGGGIPSFGQGSQLPVDFGGQGSMFQGSSFPAFSF